MKTRIKYLFLVVLLSSLFSCDEDNDICNQHSWAGLINGTFGIIYETSVELSEDMTTGTVSYGWCGLKLELLSIESSNVYVYSGTEFIDEPCWGEVETVTITFNEDCSINYSSGTFSLDYSGDLQPY